MTSADEVTLLRDKDSGLLVLCDVVENVAKLLGAAVLAVRELAKKGAPLTRNSNSSGIHAMRMRLPKCLRMLTRGRLKALFDDAKSAVSAVVAEVQAL